MRLYTIHKRKNNLLDTYTALLEMFNLDYTIKHFIFFYLLNSVINIASHCTRHAIVGRVKTIVTLEWYIYIYIYIYKIYTSFLHLINKHSSCI